MALRDRKCETCQFWHRTVPSDIGGECRLNPPVLVRDFDYLTRELVQATMWPFTKETQWCGQWAPDK